MRFRLRQVLLLLLPVFLSSCNVGESTTPETTPTYPARTRDGKDFMVCIVKTDLKNEGLREKRGMLFNGEEVEATYVPSSHKILLSAQRDIEYDLETEIELVVNVQNPKPNVAYNVYADYNGWGETFVADQSRSTIRFSRIDTLVAAGEFAFTAVDMAKSDTVRLVGYFDIPFSK
ncbi:hypothetical protein [Polluticoccus soli]|uniref:hypothetical protein n=1 Tax=Polluticoccus soli TaxID=3034150 RepID=UPI0023E19ADF|nr:hypothetical protein [Flavipsychrobacter sp. JY13-12]